MKEIPKKSTTDSNLQHNNNNNKEIKNHVKAAPTTFQKIIGLHQWACLIIVGCITIMSLIDPYYKKFYILQYKNEKTGLYTKGYDDINFVFFWIIALIFLRWFIQCTVLTV